MEKFYKILEIHPNATEQEVRQAYRDLVKIWHPDRFMHDVRLQKKAEDKLKGINDAYQQIIDHLNNSSKAHQSQQSKGGNQEKAASQQAREQPRNSWICPECLRMDSIDMLTCSCGFKTNIIEIRIYRTDQTSADLYETLLFDKSMGYVERVVFLSRYLLRRFPDSTEAKKIRDDARSEASPKQTKPTKGFSNKGTEYSFFPLTSHLKENRVLYIVLSLIFLLIIIGNLNSESSRNEPAVSKQPPQKSEPIFTQPIQPLPKNGKIKRFVTDEAIAPLSIVTRESGHHYFVKIVDWYTGNLILTVFIRSGQSVNVDVPLGAYKLKYATGIQWYGTTFLFGPETTTYSEADKKFVFEEHADHVSGYTVELILQPHGNLTTNRISVEQF